MRFLVTGATGFVGRYLCKQLLQDGHDVASLVRRGGTAPEQTQELVADLFDESAVYDAVTEFAPDGIFHLAATETWPRRSKQIPAETIRGNVTTTLSILEAARRMSQSPRVLLASSVLLQEPGPPATPYAVSKQLCEEVGGMYAEQYDVPVIIARPSNHTGPGQPDIFAVPNFARQVAEIEAGIRKKVEVGDLSAYKDFTDVRDMVRAYALLIQKGDSGATYVIASGQTVQMAEILAYLASQSTATIDPMPLYTNIVDQKAVSNGKGSAAELLDASPIRALGWQPSIDLTHTWREMLEAARPAAVNQSQEPGRE